MSATLPVYDETTHEAPVKVTPKRPVLVGDITHDDPMTKAEREELAELREMVHQMATMAKMQSPPLSNGEKRRQNWFMASIATITILGAGGNFVGSSGIWLGKKDLQTELTNTEVKELKMQIEYLKTWNEKLRNNMSAYGWLIDMEGNVSRIERQQRRK